MLLNEQFWNFEISFSSISVKFFMCTVLFIFNCKRKVVMQVPLYLNEAIKLSNIILNIGQL